METEYFLLIKKHIGWLILALVLGVVYSALNWDSRTIKPERSVFFKNWGMFAMFLFFLGEGIYWGLNFMGLFK